MEDGLPRREEESLRTPSPLLPPPTAQDPTTLVTPSLTTTCGLFDSRDEGLFDTGKDPLLTEMTTAVGGDAAQPRIRLESLDPTELESLLADLSQPGCPDDNTNAKEDPLNEDQDDAVVPNEHSDHDYCEDWAVLSEFIQLTKPCLESPDSTDAAGVVGEEGGVAEFLETAVDLEPILLASLKVPKSPAQPESEPRTKDAKYWERRRKNNAASAASRRTRKEKRVALMAEAADLQRNNEHLHAEVERLQSLAAEWKQRLLHLIG